MNKQLIEICESMMSQAAKLSKLGKLEAIGGAAIVSLGLYFIMRGARCVGQANAVHDLYSGLLKTVTIGGK